MNLPLTGKHALVTAGPTQETIDPVRYISNYSSGKQGYAIANALRDAGARVTLVSGPVQLPVPAGVKCVQVQTADEMFEASKASLPADIAVFTAAVADYKVANKHTEKLKKTEEGIPQINLEMNPDILASISAELSSRPRLVVGFAAETENVIAYAKKKLLDKKCDWIIANDVSSGKAFHQNDNTVSVITNQGAEDWPNSSKKVIAQRLVEKMITELG